MSEAWLARQADIAEKKKEKMSESIRQEMEKGGSEAALMAALSIVRDQRPDLLNEDQVQ